MVSISENFGADLDSARVAVVAFHGIGGNAGKMENICLAMVIMVSSMIANFA